MNEYQGESGAGTGNGTRQTGDAISQQTVNESSVTGNRSEAQDQSPSQADERDRDVAPDVDADATSSFVVSEGATYIEAFIVNEGEADYFDVELSGDANARGRLFRAGDVYRISSFKTSTVKNAEDLTRWRSDSFNGAQIGDRITVRISAVIDGVSTVVHERTDVLGPSEVDADLNYIFDTANNKVHVILMNPRDADQVNVRFENGGGGAVLARGKLEKPGDEIVIGPTDIGDRRADSLDSKLDSYEPWIEYNDSKALDNLDEDEYGKFEFRNDKIREFMTGNGLTRRQGEIDLDSDEFDEIFDDDDEGGDSTVNLEDLDKSEFINQAREDIVPKYERKKKFRVAVATGEVDQIVQRADLKNPPGVSTFGHADVSFPENQARNILGDGEWLRPGQSVTINATAVMAGNRGRSQLESEVLYVTGDLSDRTEVQP